MPANAFDGPSTASRPRMVVLGSLNMDLVLRVPRAPEAGETLQGQSLAQHAGGKGGNQAVSCARQGAEVRFWGCVGDDAHGRSLRAALQVEGIDVQGLQTEAGAATGVALITVDDAAQNRIVVVPGSNASLRLQAGPLRAQLKSADFLLLQFEVPIEQVLQAAQWAHEEGCPVMLNPSPVSELPAALWSWVDTLVLNEIEAQTLCGSAPVQTPAQALLAAQVLRRQGPRRVVVTLGAQGAVACDAQGGWHVPAPRVQAVDTTAAGDTFLGALAQALAQAAA